MLQWTTRIEKNYISKIIQFFKNLFIYIFSGLKKNLFKKIKIKKNFYQLTISYLILTVLTIKSFEFIEIKSTISVIVHV